MKKKFYVILFICFILFAMFFMLNKWNINIYMESLQSPPGDKIDLKIVIDDKVVFNDTLQQNLGGYPTHIVHPMRIGYHTISISSEQANFQESKKVFLFFYNYILLYYSFDEISNKPALYLSKGKGEFGFE